MARHTAFHTRRSASLVGLLLLAVLAGCGDTPLPTEPDPCPAELTRTAGRWTGRAGEVRVTMRLVPTRVPRDFFGFTFMADVVSGSGVADHPDDSRDVTFRVEFSCSSGRITSTVVANAPPPEPGAPSPFAYDAATLNVVSVTSTQLVADLVRASASVERPNPFDTDARIIFERLNPWESDPD